MHSPQRSPKASPPIDYHAESNRLILAIQTATPASRERFAYARKAWDKLDAAGRAEAEANREENILALMRLNHGLIKRYRMRWFGMVNRCIDSLDVDRAIEAAYVSSIMQFNLESGWRFSSYSGYSMQNGVVRQAYGLTNMAQPENITAWQHKITTAIDNFERVYGRKPDAKEIAAQTGIKLGKVETILQIPRVIPGDGYESEPDDEDMTILERVPDPCDLDQAVADRARLELVTATLGEGWGD